VYVAPSTENGVAVSDFCCANISTCCVLSVITPLELPLLLLEPPELLLELLLLEPLELEPPELLLEVELPPPELLELLEVIGVEWLLEQAVSRAAASAAAPNSTIC
jgi:hypothetical protein